MKNQGYSGLVFWSIHLNPNRWMSGHLLIYFVIMQNDKVVFFYLLMLVAHVGHILEELWGRFWLIDAFFGAGWFCVAN